MSTFATPTSTRYQLRFRSLANHGFGYAFPCDAAGRVDLDALGPRALNDYLYARAVIGGEFTGPMVELRH